MKGSSQLIKYQSDIMSTISNSSIDTYLISRWPLRNGVSKSRIHNDVRAPVLGGIFCCCCFVFFVHFFYSRITFTHNLFVRARAPTIPRDYVITRKNVYTNIYKPSI